LNVVGYVRLSRDEDKENISSINSQIDIINEYASDRNWVVSKIYIDDNFTGYNFNRPDFSEMMDLIEEGKIKVVITKDLSRIGRNNGKVLVLIDKLIELKIRLILITEKNGGLDILEDDQDMLGIKTWYNEMYVKDISRKIRTNMASKQKKGELIMGNFYGYVKERVGDKVTLKIDEDIAPVIQLIFKLYIAGNGYKRICDHLTEKGYPTPSEYIRLKHEERGRVFKNTSTKLWQTHMIQRVISGDVYIGTLTTNKRHAMKIKGKQEKVPFEKQYKFVSNHPAIISKENFRLAQEVRNRRNIKVHSINKVNDKYIFSSFLECGDCGHAVVGKNLGKKEVRKGYDCTMYMKYGNKHCCCHAIKEEKLLFFFKEFLRDTKDIYRDYINSIRIKENKDNRLSNLEKLEKELDFAIKELELLYTQKLKDILEESNNEYKGIVESTYDAMEEEKKKIIHNLMQKVNELKSLKVDSKEKELRSNIEIFDSVINCEKPARGELEIILDKILIGKDRNPEFILKVEIDKSININYR